MTVSIIAKILGVCVWGGGGKVRLLAYILFSPSSIIFGVKKGTMLVFIFLIHKKDYMTYI